MTKKIMMLLLLLICTALRLHAQELPENFRKAIDLMMEIRTAVGSGNTAALKEANLEWKKYNIVYNSNIFCRENDISVNGHFVYDTEFIDSLLAGNGRVYRFAQRYAERDVDFSYGSSTSDKLYIYHGCVEAKGKMVYDLSSSGKQNLAVVTEPEGAVTTRIEAINSEGKSHFNDDEDVSEGRPSRVRSLELSPDLKNQVVLTIINTTDRDISFAILMD